MATDAHRLRRLEAAAHGRSDRLAWADVHAALTRQQAKARLMVYRAMRSDAADPRQAEALAMLRADSPEANLATTDSVG